MKIESDKMRDKLIIELNAATRTIYHSLKGCYIDKKAISRLKWHFGFAEGIEFALHLITQMELEIDPHMNDEFLGIVPEEGEDK